MEIEGYYLNIIKNTYKIQRQKKYYPKQQKTRTTSIEIKNGCFYNNY